MIISRAPLRISFFGGGTDFPEYFIEHGGAVLATAIDKYSFVTASTFQSRLFDYSIRVSYSRGELVKTVAEIQHPVFRECLKFCGLSENIEIHTVADLPAFTGLGSSSSFMVSLLQALHAYKGEFVPPLQIAYEAIHLERHVLNECVGVQDQTMAAVGGTALLEFRTEDDIRVQQLPISPGRKRELESHLFFVFTGIKRRAHEIEAKKVKGFAANLEALHRMRKMAEAGAGLLASGQPMEAFGRLLHEAWTAKKSLEASVSNPEIDRLYQTGLDAGAWGGKLLGAGGGGFLLFCAPPESHPALAKAFTGYHQIDVGIDAPGCGIVFAQ